jgi:hypothetical protein
MELATQTNGHTGLAWPGRDWFVKRWGWGGKSIEAAIVRLHKLGLIEIVERGMWRRRTRYRVTLLQSIGPNPLGPMEASVGPSQRGDRSYPARSQVLAGKDRLSESSRSQSGEMTTDGAARLAPVRSLGAAPRQAVPAIQQEIMDALGCGLSEAKEWATSKLNGRAPRNMDAYLRTCLENHIAETHRKPATKKTETHRKPATEKTGGGFSCPRCGRGFPSKSSLGSHAGHCATTQCTDCNSTVKKQDLNKHRLTHGIDLEAERRAFVASLLAQPPCIHGQPGGNIPQPGNTEDAGWMRCPLCRNAQRSA